VTVVLTGDGSDELFGGYDRYRFERWVRWASQSHLPVAVLGRVPERFGGARNLARRAGIDSSSPERYLSWWRVFEEAELDRMLTASDAGGCAEPAAAVALLRATIGDVRAEDAVAAADLRWWIPDECNARVDHAMMSAAVEARAVFEDHHLVEALAARRMSAKVGRVRWRRKAILVDAFRELLPEVVRRRPKWGWFSPVHYWVNDVLWDDLAEVVRWLPETGLFSPDVRRMVDERPTSDPHAVWALGVFGLWYRWLLEGSPPDPST
jgi:asparagine synthase (glutamine-hydrolysing)